MEHFDFIVIGAGPAGMMAAGQAASSGVKTLILEKMERPGRKLEITGKGRCNLTNIETLDRFIGHFNREGRFLYSAFSRFFSEDLVRFFERLGVKTRVERGGRVFPVSSDAHEIVDALARWMGQTGVTSRTASRVTALLVEDRAIRGVRVLPGRERGGRRAADRMEEIQYSCEHVLIATGGLSYPGTGSTGDGYRLAQSVGHRLIPVRPALVPLDTAGNLAQRLQGLALRNVRVRVHIGDVPTREAFGEMLFTHFGVSGPIMLTLSRDIVDALSADSSVEISIDLKPALDEGKLDARLLRDIDQAGTKQFNNLLKGLLPSKMIPVCIDQVDIPPSKRANQITAEERTRLRDWLKDFRLTITGHRPIAQAIVTAGGIDTREVDPRTMQSRLVDGLYFAGEVLDLDADTGGYNLQAAFSTGWLAGRSVSEKYGRPAN
ncbi:MAG: NAD(P)/FAD-dependent oxidoreductase [Anaerolineales bacterium]|nr:NAD(P)/FAD-dependent oxidoreductase [Anaerolineales bacterium]